MVDRDRTDILYLLNGTCTVHVYSAVDSHYCMMERVEQLGMERGSNESGDGLYDGVHRGNLERREQ